MLLAEISNSKAALILGVLAGVLVGVIFVVYGCLHIFGYEWLQKHKGGASWHIFLRGYPMSRKGSIIFGITLLLLGSSTIVEVLLRLIDRSIWRWLFIPSFVALIVAAIHDRRQRDNR